MEDYNPSYTPMDHLVPGNGVSFNTKEYQRLTSSLMWLSLRSRLDITFTARFLGRFNLNPTTNYYAAQKRLLRYLRKTVTHGILYKSHFKGEPLVGFSDSN